MIRFRAYICLLIFVFSTVGANASVHLCNGEVMEVSLLADASCNHEKPKKKKEKKQKKCKSHCCHKEDSSKEKKPEKSKKGKKDCCDTEKLFDVEIFLAQIQNQQFDLAVKLVPSFYDFYFENHKVLLKNIGIAFVPPPPDDGDICVDFQCFRI